MEPPTQNDDGSFCGETANFEYLSAIVNTAVREGLYAHILPPHVTIKSWRAEDGELTVDLDYKIPYRLEAVTERREKYLDAPPPEVS